MVNTFPMTLAIALFSLTFATNDAVVGVEYSVTVATDPTNGPFLVGREIEFTCDVDPISSERVTYSWNAVKDAYGSTTLTSSLNTMSYTPVYSDLHFSWFFCKVATLNGTHLGVGRKLVEFQGFIFSEEPLVRSFNYGDVFYLRVNISNSSLASYIRTLTWYHNETQISHSNRISVQNGGRELVVYDALSRDAGIYRVEVTSLNFSLSYCCDSTWLYFVKNNAVYAPVTFRVWELRSSNFNSDEMSLEASSMYYYPLVMGDSSTLLTIQDNETLTYDSILYSVLDNSLRYSSSSLSVNGTTLISNQRKFNLSQTFLGSNIMKEINFQYNTSDEGLYIYLSTVYYYYIYYDYYYDYLCRCHKYRNHMVYDLNIFYMSYSTLHFILKTYKPPLVNISSYFDMATDMELLNCTAYGGIPESYNITFEKQEVNETGKNLQINPSRFGEYICTVESLYNTTTVSLSITEKESFQLLLVPEGDFNQTQCLEWKNNKSINLLHEKMTNIMKTSCGCEVDIYHISAVCTITRNLLVRGVINSNRQGNVTAGMVVDMLQEFLLTSTDPIIATVGQQFFKLNIHCPPRVNLASPNLCERIQPFINDLEDNQQAQNDNVSSSTIGGSFVGGMVAGFLTCIAILCTGICLLKLKSDINMRRAGSSNANTHSSASKMEEVVMDTNKAYEMVEMHYNTPLARHPVQSRRREEAVYECPAS